MKKYMFLSILLMQFILSYGQSIIDTNKLWSICYFHYWNFSQTTEWIRFTSDTIIGSDTCKRVEMATDQSHFNWAFHGYARETMDKRIYYRVNASQPEKLLYNMNVQVGDSLMVYTLYNYPSAIFDSMMYHVTSKDSILVGSSYLTQLHLSVNLAGYFMEVEQWVGGVGSLGGMLHNTTGKVGGDGFSLMCYFENSVLLWHRPDWAYCYIVTDAGNYVAPSDIVSIRPNPLTSVSVIKTEGKYARSLLKADFYDSSGKLVASQCFINELTINRRSFEPGLFYYIITCNDNKVACGRLMVY
jgi:hypothetical protein